MFTVKILQTLLLWRLVFIIATKRGILSKRHFWQFRNLIYRDVDFVLLFVKETWCYCHPHTLPLINPCSFCCAQIYGRPFCSITATKHIHHLNQCSEREDERQRWGGRRTRGSWVELLQLVGCCNSRQTPPN